MQTLTREERAIIARFLARSRSRWDLMSQYAVYLVPSFAFAVYGLLHGDVVAVSLAYLVLLFSVLVYLNYQRRAQALFRSAMLKYEANMAETTAAAREGTAASETAE